MSRKKGLPPIVARNPNILILGSFPGEASLNQRRYYASPRNLFWHIIERICGDRPDNSYEARIAMLKKAGICLWDVIESCEREGSSDRNIRNANPNDFRTFLSYYKNVEAIFFNGKKARHLFEKYVESES